MNQMISFTLGESQESNIDFDKQSNKANEGFYQLSSQIKQRLPAKDITQEIKFSTNYINVLITITHKKFHNDIFHS